MNEKKINDHRIRNDVIFIAAILIISALGMLFLFVFREEGNIVKVTIDGELYGVYSLSDNVAEDIISGDKGENVNRLIISEGKVYVESASCPDEICVAHRPIFRNGESIICPPNKVVITVYVEEKSNDEPDIVV